MSSSSPSPSSLPTTMATTRKKLTKTNFLLFPIKSFYFKTLCRVVVVLTETFPLCVEFFFSFSFLFFYFASFISSSRFSLVQNMHVCGDASCGRICQPEITTISQVVVVVCHKLINPGNNE